MIFDPFLAQILLDFRHVSLSVKAAFQLASLDLDTIKKHVFNHIWTGLSKEKKSYFVLPMSMN